MKARRLLHACLVLLGVIPWTIAYFMGVLVVGFAVAADRVWPEADYGNCWSFTLPKWIKHGGYIALRPATGVRLLTRLFIPHAILVHELPGLVQQTRPVRRSVAMWVPWRTLYFKYRVATTEPKRPA